MAGKQLTYSVNIKSNAKGVESQLRSIERLAGKLNGKHVNVRVRADTGKARAELNSLWRVAGRLDARRPTIDVTANTSAAMSDMTRLNTLAGQLGARRVTVAVSANTSAAVSQLNRVRTLASSIGATRATATVGVNSGRAESKLNGILGKLKEVGSKSVTATVNAAGNAAGRIGGAAKSAAPRGGMGSIALGAVGGMAGVGAMAAANGIKDIAKSSLNASRDFDSAMSQVAATMGKSVGDMNGQIAHTDNVVGGFTGNLRDFAQHMGSTTKFTATESAEALNYMALAGYDAQKSMDMMPSVLNLAAAGNMQLARASDMVTDAQTALGLDSKQTLQMVDQMAAASSNTNTSVEQLGDAFLRVGATARSLSGGTKEASQILGILADNGTKGAEAGTALRNVMQAFQSKKGEQTLEKLGVSAYDANGKLRPLQDTFLDMNKAMGGMTQQQRDKTIGGMFNKYDLAKVNALLGTSKDRWNAVADKIGDCEGAAKRMADTQLDNLEGDVTLFKSALEGTQIAMTEGMTPALRDFVQLGTQGLTDLTAKIREGGLIDAAGSLGDTVSQGLLKVTKMLPDMLSAGGAFVASLSSGIADALPSMIDEGSNLLGNFAKSFSDNARDGGKAIGGSLGNIVQSSVKNLPQLTGAGMNIMKGLANGFNGAMTEFSSHAGEIVPLIDSAIKTGMNQLSANGEEIVGNIVGGIKASGHLFGSAIESLFESDSGDGSSAGSRIVDSLAQGIASGIPALVEAGTPMIASLMQGLGSAAPTLMAAGATVVSSLVQGLASAAPMLIQSAMPMVQGVMQGIVAAAPQLLQAGMVLATQLCNGLSQAVGMVAPYIGPLVSGICNVLLSNGPALMNAGVQLVVQIANGLMEAAPAIGATIPTLLGQLVDAVISNGPALVDAVGGVLSGLVDGLMVGLFGNVPVIGDWVRDTFHGAEIEAQVAGAGAGTQFTAGLDSSISGHQMPELETPRFASGGAVQAGLQVPTDIGSGILQGAPAVQGATQSMMADATSGMEASGMEQVGLQVPTGIASGVEAGAPMVTSAVQGVVSSVSGSVSGSGNMNATGTTLMTDMAQGVNAGGAAVTAASQQVALQSSEAANAQAPMFNATGVNCAVNFGLGITTGGAAAIAAAQSVMAGCIAAFQSGVGQAHGIGAQISAGIAAGISSGSGAIAAAARAAVQSAVAAAKAAADIHSPSRVFADEVGAMEAKGIEVGFTAEMANVNKAVGVSVGSMAESPAVTAGLAEAPNFEVPGLSSVSNSSANTVHFAPNITIEVNGAADQGTVEDMRSQLYGTVKDLFEEFMEQTNLNLSLQGGY